MVFGLDAILPMEFLLPTLRVAKKLEWSRHEFSERLDDLDKLDETRLKVVMRIYANKCMQKVFYDRLVKNKELQDGDVVLAYKLKEHTSKLQKRKMEPYIIHQLSSSGAVKLATLEDETPWTN